ncbi:MAG: 16S rRNA (cytidine(1402)-2'-O)-methyltransferase [Caldiserica bacterium]|nr:16S rRNA (cytidine(1402)-2'-O)-methyltransferase [Caldisericota bacterium]
MAGTLYLCATPIGNLEDVTLRVLRVLREVDLIVAEDTRHTEALLRRYGIPPKFGPSLYEGAERERVPLILAELEAGKDVALVADAGTPLISDPGYPLVRACVEAGIRVVPVPGPAAFLAALVASGLPTDSFVFLGMLPRKRGHRREVLEGLIGEDRTCVMYESPHRLRETLGMMAELYPHRPLVLARELTKAHEEFLRGTVTEVLAEVERREAIKGEVVLVLGGDGGGGRIPDEELLRDFYELLLSRGRDPRGALR